MVPELDLKKIATTKCLLFGAGTLGCSVARNLIAWGIRVITFVDSGHVSYSNPVRQSLFRYDDAVNRREKAKTAAERLLEICPGIVRNQMIAFHPIPLRLIYFFNRLVDNSRPQLTHPDARVHNRRIIESQSCEHTRRNRITGATARCYLPLD